MKNKPQTLRPEDRIIDMEENSDDYIDDTTSDVEDWTTEPNDEISDELINALQENDDEDIDNMSFEDVLASIYPPTLSNPVNPDYDTMLELAVKQSSIIQDFERLLINQHDAISTLRTQTFESIDECQSFVAMFNAVNEFIQLTGEQLAIAKTARYLKEHPQ